MVDPLTLRPADPADLGAAAELYLDARRAAVPAMPALVRPEGEVRAWITAWDLAAREVWVAEQAGDVVGFASLERDWLDSLYVAPGHVRSGVGSALLEVVKTRRPDGFGLWVFESNAPARSFYRRHGLLEREHTDGGDNEERSPDLRMVWPGASRLGAGAGVLP